MNHKRIKVLFLIFLFLVSGFYYSNDQGKELLMEKDVAVSNETEEMEEKETEALVASAKKTIRIHVCGAVKEAGVYELFEGAIVADAIELAGGSLKGAAEDYLNLALEISDGSKVYVPWKDELKGNEGVLLSSGTVGTDASKDDGLVNINTASREILMTLTGIGEAKADAIVAYREANGAFSSIEAIKNVSGIKDAAYEKIKDSISV